MANIFNMFSKKQKVTTTIIQDKPVEKGRVDLLRTISTDFIDITQPLIDETRNRGMQFIFFGESNLYPQILNQLYISSPMLSQCINFKVHSLVGSGYEIVNEEVLSTKEIINFKTFKKVNDYKQQIRKIAKDWSLHGRVCVLMQYDPIKKIYTRFRVIDPSNIRNPKPRSLFNDTPDFYLYSEDYEYSFSGKRIYPYSESCEEELQILEIKNLVGATRSYGLPDWISAGNWAKVSSDLPLMNKSAIENSISPGLIYKYPYELSPEEHDAFISNLEMNGKGAKNRERAQLIEARSRELMPDIDTIQYPDNLSIFEHSSVEQKQEIAMANSINPVLMGIQIPGSLGQNEQIVHAANMFKTNWLEYNKEIVEDFINKINYIFDQPKIALNEVVIIDENIFIKDTTEEKKEEI